MSYYSSSWTSIYSTEPSSTADSENDNGSDGIDEIPSTGINAAALTDFMAKAHEEKITAMGRIEAKYKQKIAEMEEKMAEMELLASQTTPNPGIPNSFAFPATNKSLSEKVAAYRKFVSFGVALDSYG
jgi:hypothetical protein